MFVPDARGSENVPNRLADRLLLYGGILLAWIVWGGIDVFRLAAVPELDWELAFWYGFPGAMIWAVLTPLVVAFARRHPLRRNRRLAALGLHSAAAVGFALLHASLDAGFASLMEWLTNAEGPGWTFVFFKVLRYGLQTNVLVYTLVAGLVLFIEHERHLSRSERRADALKAQLMEARLAGLERQLRPHFLFNALNTVSGLMGGDTETGRRVVRRLGELLRAGLQGEPGQRIPLRRELDLARAYLEIEQARFEDRLRVSLDVEPAKPAERDRTLEFPVPALILQPLLENALNHGIAKREDGGSVRVLAERREDHLVLIVEDDGPGLAASVGEHGGFGVGLVNTRERLRALYGDREGGYLSLESGGTGTGSEDPSRGPRTRARLLLPARPREEE